MQASSLEHIHFIGLGGINMSAVAKLVLAKGLSVSGSDMAENEQTRILSERGAKVIIGEHEAENIPAECDLVIYTSAAPESNPERVEAARRGIEQLTNFQFLGEWLGDKKVVLVTGTHGKSTTTGMLGSVLVKAELDPTVIVGSKVPGFTDGNLRIGASDIAVVEGDEYARHFLEFKPFGVVINNIELDHTDVFSSLKDMVACFGALLDRVQENGVVVANMGDANVAGLIERAADILAQKKVRVIGFNSPDSWQVSNVWQDGFNRVRVEKTGVAFIFNLLLPGAFNALNAAGASLMARELGADYPPIATALGEFPGIWRRFEFLSEHDGARWYSDYGHHPTAVAATIKAVKEMFPERRLVLCFQPHHRNRTKHLFFEFESCFAGAEVVVLCEIYDVAGRDAGADADISSRDVYEAAIRHDREQGGDQHMEYAATPQEAIERTATLSKPGDIVIVMGAGDIDGAVRRYLTQG